MPLTLYSGTVSLYCAKVEIALKEKQLEAEIIRCPFSAKDGFAKHPEILRISPRQQIPVLVDEDLELFDSTVINEYLEDIAPHPALWPVSAQERARARLWELKADEVLGAPLGLLLAAHRKSVPQDQIEAAKADIAGFYDQVDSKLWEQPYLVSEFSYADIALFVAIVYAKLCGAAPSTDLKALHTWMRRVGERDSVRTVLDQQLSYLQQLGATQN